jgi:hypothetical protein
MEELILNKKLRLLAIVLAFVITFSTVAPISRVNAKTYDSPEQTYIVEENGVKYTIYVYRNTNGTKITIHRNDSRDFVVEEISNDGEKIKVAKYKYENDSFNASEQIYEKSKVQNLEEYNENPTTHKVKGIDYNNKNYGGFGSDKYYYQYGYNGKKTYCKVGDGNTSNSIRIDNSSVNEKKCDAYADCLDNSRACYHKACVYAAASGLGIGIILGIVLANITLPATVIGTIVVAAVGGGSSIVECVNSLVDSYSYSTKAKNQFTKVIVL